MATTAIWPIRGRLDHVMTYTENPDKTANPKWERADLQALSDVVEYAMDEAKTRGAVNELAHIADEGQCQRQYFTNGVNCDPATARDAMNMTKRRFSKEGGIVAFHGYQSFAPGEVTPEQAHLIGLELAQRLWGERFEVVVSTHLNTGVVHNHFVLNSVSCVDGLRYCDNKKTYAQMRRASDELCREHSISVITQENGRSAHYREWMADHAGERTWRTAIREDVDKAIAASMTWQAFLAQMRQLGYEVKTGVKHIAVRPPGKERFVRLRSLGDKYTEDAIRQQILRQRAPQRPKQPEPPRVIRIRVKGDFWQSKVTWKSLRALYYFYLRKLRQARQARAPAPFVLREDLRSLSTLSEQAQFLHRYKLDTAKQLASHRADCDGQIILLCVERKELKNQLRRKDIAPEQVEPIAVRIVAINEKLKTLRKEVRLCDDILIRSVQIKENYVAAKQQEKEEQTHEPIGRSGGTVDQHGHKHDRQGR